MKKRAISLFLLIVMLISLVPAQAFAENIADESAVSSDIGEIAAEEAAQPEEETVPDEEVEIIPMPEEEYEEITEEAEDAESEAVYGESTSEDSEETAENEDGLFPGMPEGYELTVEQAAAKQALNEYGVLDMLYDDAAGVDYVDGEVFFLADTPEYAQTVAEAYGATLTEYRSGVATIALNGASVIDAVTAAADMSNNMPVVEPNYIYKTNSVIEAYSGDVSTYALDGNGKYVKESWKTWIEKTANPDPYISQPSSSDYQYMHDIVNTYEAWGVTKGKGVTVAVIDTGVDSHEDLDIAGGSIGDIDGHGTHVAGIIAAKEGNGIGGAGIAPEAQIYSEQVCDEVGNAELTDIIAGLGNVVESAGAYNIKVINISLGRFEYSPSYEQAVKAAITAGITVVAAMGDEGTNIQSYPAAFNIPGLIAVQSSNSANTLSYFSNYGAWADVIAPGSDIMSTLPSEGCGKMSGTAMASAVVSGMCALYLSANPGATPTQVESAIKSAASKGIADASKLFNITKMKPEITNIKADEKGKDGTLPYGSDIIIEVSDTAEYIIYTVGSKTPSIKNGVVTGTIISVSDDDDGKKATLPLTSEYGFTVGKNVTVKAMAVNDFGTSRVKSLSVKVGYAEPERIEIISKPEISIDSETGEPIYKLISGKTFNLKAKVYPEAANQNVVWVIEKDDDTCKGTSLNKTSGALKTGSKDEGTITVYACSAADETVASDPIEIEIAPLHPTKKIALSYYNEPIKTWTFYINSSSVSSPIDVTAVSYKYDPNDKKKTLYEVYDDVYTWKSSNTKVATVDENGTVDAVGKGSATITCTANDGTNVKASFSVRVLTCADGLSISGLSAVAPGKTTQYTAIFLPKTVNYKTVEWDVIDYYNSGITIDQRGRVTVPKGTPDNTYFQVVASTKLDVQATKVVWVSSKTSSIQITSYDKFGGQWKFNTKSNTITEAKLFSTDKFDTDSKHYSAIQLQLIDTPSCEVEWTSSNPKVATVTQTGYVKAISAGSAKITCKASDAGRKSSSVNIVVINPVSSVNAASQMTQSTADGSLPILASGKSVRNTVTIGSTYGTPAIKKVEWSYRVEAEVYDEESGESYVKDLTDYAALSRLISINKTSGQLTASKNAYSALRTYCEGDSFTVYAVAKTTDGSNLSSEVPYKLTYGPISILQVAYKNENDENPRERFYTTLRLPEPISRNNDDESSLDDNCVTLKVCLNYGYSADWTAKSSNPNVAGAVLTYVEHYNIMTDETDLVPAVKIIPGRKAGSATITLTATDGSNKKANITVKVK